MYIVVVVVVVVVMMMMMMTTTTTTTEFAWRYSVQHRKSSVTIKGVEVEIIQAGLERNRDR